VGSIVFRPGVAFVAGSWLVVAGCGGPPTAESPERSREDRAVSVSPVVTRSAGSASQQLPRASARPPTRGLIRGRLPAIVREASEIEGEGRTLVDGREPGSVRLVQPASFVRIARDERQSVAAIEAVRVRGRGRGRIELRTERDGAWRSAVSMQFESQSSEWKTVELPSDVRPTVVELRLAGDDRSIEIHEVELWGRSPESAPVRWPEERLMRDESIARHIAASPIMSRVSAVDRAGNAQAGRFIVEMPDDGGRCARTFLRFSLDGARHWTRIAHSINGVALGSNDAAVAGAGGIQLEEVPAASVRAGRNEVTFEPNASLGPSGYVVRGVELLCIDAVEQQIDRAVPASPLLDDDPTTGASSSGATSGRTPVAVAAGAGGGARWLRWDVREDEQPHVVAFRTVGSLRGAIELRSETRAGASVTQRVSLDGRSAGWHDIVLPDPWPEGSPITAQIALERESTGSVAELRVVSSAVRDESPGLVVTFPHRGECVGRRSQVRAFVRGPTSDREWTVFAGGVRAAVQTNAVAVLDDVPAPMGGAQEIEVRATNGELTLSEWIALAPCQAESVASTTRPDEGAPFGVVARPNASEVLRAGALRVEIPAGAVATETRVTARPLAATDVRSLEQGMHNVTGGGSAWRLGPSPMRFLRGLKIAVAIARDRLPAGKTERDVKLYYFDEGARQWRQVASEVVDGFVVAQTDHFTDWVAATVTSPEAPETSAGNANSLGALGAGHPLAGVHGASIPTANSQGTASTTIPIDLPAGRAGMQPSLSLQYDSSNTASGYVSAGWSLPIPSITIDTRFGVPTYSGNEQYTLNGAAIVFVEKLPDGPGGAIRDRFEPRVLGSNLRIVRVREGALVRWEVTDPSGTITHYGETANARLTAHASATVPSITPEVGARPLFGAAVERTGAWFASRVVDTHANEVRYLYRTATGALAEVAPAITPEPWVQLYPVRIEYTTTTGAMEGSGYYKVFFEFEPRKESGTSARFGFLTHNRERLRAIRVEAGAVLTRRNRLHYGEDDFGRAQFTALDVIGTDGIATLHRQQFDYYRAPRDSTGSLGFTNATGDVRKAVHHCADDQIYPWKLQGILS
jgi:hypothetical protein